MSDKDKIVHIAEWKTKQFGSEEYRKDVTDKMIYEMGQDIMKVVSSYGYDVIELGHVYFFIAGLKALIYQCEGFHDGTRDIVAACLNSKWKKDIIFKVADEMPFLPDSPNKPNKDDE